MAQRRNCGGKGNCRNYQVVAIFTEIWTWVILNTANWGISLVSCF